MAIRNDELAAIDQGWLDLHTRAFEGRTWLVLRPMYRHRQLMTYRDKVVAVMPNHHGQWRPADQWDVVVEEVIEVCEERQFRIRVSSPSVKHHRLRLVA
jgi:hypothetical protein